MKSDLGGGGRRGGGGYGIKLNTVHGLIDSNLILSKWAHTFGSK